MPDIGQQCGPAGFQPFEPVCAPLQRREGRLKDGEHYVIRAAVPEDDAAVMSLIGGVAAEGLYLMREASEYGIFDEAQECALIAACDCRVGLMLVAETGTGAETGAGQLVGLLSALQEENGRFAKLRHGLTIGVMLAPALRGRGLGTLLLAAAIDWARAAGYRRMRADVLATNAPSLALFSRFAVEVRRPAFARLGDALVDMLVLGLDLTQPGAAAGRAEAPAAAPLAPTAAYAVPVAPAAPPPSGPWPARDVVLSDGERVRLRPGAPEDAAPILDMLNVVCREREFLLTDLFNFTPEEERAFLSGFQPAESLLLMAEAAGGRLVACADAQRDRGGTAAKTRHVAWIGIALARDYRGRGLGRALIGQFIAWGRTAGIHYLGANVFASNARSLALFRRMGFRECGRQRDAVCIDGRYVDLVEHAILL